MFFVAHSNFTICFNSGVRSWGIRQNLTPIIILKTMTYLIYEGLLLAPNIILNTLLYNDIFIIPGNVYTFQSTLGSLVLSVAVNSFLE